MSILSGFADISIWQLLLVAVVALLASLLGGLAGYGTGALMPLVLVPLIGAGPVVPIIAISAIFSNVSRGTAYFPYVDYRRALIVIACAALTTALGAYGYTRLTNAGATIVIASMRRLVAIGRRMNTSDKFMLRTPSRSDAIIPCADPQMHEMAPKREPARCRWPIPSGM